MRPRHSLLLFIALLTGLLGAVPAANAQELLPPKITDRKFPIGKFCPLPFDLAFTPISTSVTLRFSTTTVNFFRENVVDPVWSEQYLDNICVSKQSVYSQNLGALGSNSDDCYSFPPGDELTEVFYFQNAGTLPLKDEFDTDPTARGWDVANGAYWLAGNPTAPHDPGSDSDLIPKGSLGLGVASSPGDSAYTTVTVSGLTAGTEYVLTGWWYVRNADIENVSLTVAILTDAATPVERRSWGAVKRLYR